MPGANTSELLSRAHAKGLLARIGNRGGSRYVLASRIVQLAGGTPAAARATLHKLVQAGLVGAEGNTRARRYHAR